MRQWQGYRNGINLGGWLSQFENYSKKHFDTFIQEKDFKKIAEMGFDHVRIPIDYTLLETEEGEPKEDGFFYLDKALKWCSKYGLRMLIDVHEVYGYTFDPLKRDVDRMRFFYNPGQQRRFRGLWLRIAHRYGSSFGTVAFELLNEVVLEEVAEAWNDVVRDVITAIRPLAPRTWIVVGGVRYNSVKAVELLEAPFDEHIVYNFHCYEPFAFTHQKAYWIDRMPEDFEMGYPDSIEHYREKTSVFQYEMAGSIYDSLDGDMGQRFFEQIFAGAVRKAEDNHVPLYCGEYGVIDKAPAEDTVRWLADITEVFEKYKIGRALWNYKEKDFGLTGTHLSKVREGILEILSV